MFLHRGAIVADRFPKSRNALNWFRKALLRWLPNKTWISVALDHLAGCSGSTSIPVRAMGGKQIKTALAGDGMENGYQRDDSSAGKEIGYLSGKGAAG